MGDQWLYFVLAMPFIIAVLLVGRSLKKQVLKDLFLLFWALLCFFVHMSNLYVSFFTPGNKVGIAETNHLFPKYFCNFMMFMELFVAGWWNKKTRAFQIFATLVAWGGIFGGMITLCFQYTELGDWALLVSSVSHTCMIIASSYLFVGGYVKVSVYNVVAYTIGMIGTAIIGGSLELLFHLTGLFSPNAMFLCHGPLEVPEMMGEFFFLPMLAVIFLIGVIHDFLFVSKDRRWYRSAADLTLYFRFSDKIRTRLLKTDKRPLAISVTPAEREPR